MKTLMLLAALLIGFGLNAQKEKTEKVSGKYGFSEKDPIKVGGGDMPTKVYDYLKHLRGPKGETVHYEKIGTGSSYKNPDRSITKKEKGILYRYKIRIEGSKKERYIYFDQYRYEKPKVLKGYTRR